MVRVRLQTKFLLSMVLISAGLTSLSLLLVRQSVRSEVLQEIFADLQNSVTTFQNFQREKVVTLSHSADLLADLPNLRALMTTHDAATIEDGSAPLWKLAGSDLFVLADRDGKVVALHTNAPGFTREMAQASLTASLANEQRWWFGSHNLYEVFVKPIYFGPAAADRRLGFLVIGFQIDDRVTSQISRIAGGKVAFYYADRIVSSNLDPTVEAELSRQAVPESGRGLAQPLLIQIGKERFLVLETTLEMAPQGNPKVRLTVLKSYDQATAFLEQLNRLLLGLGLLAVILGSGLVFLISHTFTRPLSSLLSGVAALERGDFTYALQTGGRDEVAELARAFDRMRVSLLHTQQNLIESERLATIGRMASSISHDLRHSLAAIVANAEFLCESHLTTEQREDLYLEVRAAVSRMTELIDSLLEFSRTSGSLRPTYGSLRGTVDKAIQTVKSSPEFRETRIDVRHAGSVEGWFDHRKLERALFNLLLNACESLAPGSGQVGVELVGSGGGVEIRISDTGRGIPGDIRSTLFEPFVSQGKENGTGLGLTVVQKIVQDHGGEVVVEQTSPEGTVFRVTLPHPAPGPRSSDGGVSEEPATEARVNSTRQR